jgi:hypothetical protein
LSLRSSILSTATNKTNKTHLEKEKKIMAVVKVSGKVSKVFGASNQGLSLVESYKSATGEDYTRTWTVWFAVSHDVPVESEVTVFGQLSTKIEDFEDKTGKPGRKVKLDINNAQIDKPVAPVASAPF